jgi:hypothetical protein
MMKTFSHQGFRYVSLFGVLAAALSGGCAPPPAAPQTTITQSASTSVVSARTLFYDPFNAVKGEWQQVSGIWETRTDTGYLMQKSDDPRQLNAIRYLQTPRIADATIETSVRINPTRPPQFLNGADPADADLMKALRYTMGAGIIFRMKDSRNYYMFRLAGEEGAVVGKMVDGEWFDLCNPRVRDFLTGSRIGFRADNWYRLRVDVEGQQITAYIDDEPVCRVTDKTFILGSAGVVTFKTPADFDYFKMTNNKETEIRTQ